jgi:hypothetical protein
MVSGSGSTDMSINILIILFRELMNPH